MRCKHFGYCGGCRFQDIPYREQLTLKERKIKELMEQNKLAAPLKPINSFHEWFYRNKMEFTFAGENGRVICGLHAKGNKRKVFNVEECLIFSKSTNIILEKVREFAAKYNYSPYNTLTHQGFLRHLILRESKFTHELMVGIVTTSSGSLKTDEFVKELLSLDLNNEITSVHWIINDSLGDAVTFQEKKLLYKDPFITECLGDFTFRIHIDSFFQINSFGIKELYKKIASYPPLTKEAKILDLYCGIGSMGIFLAQKAKIIWGVEIQAQAVNSAVLNADINKIDNISFVCSDVRKFLAQKSLIGAIDLVVINPPRCGLSKKIKPRLLDIGAPYIFYSSCNPETLFSDLKNLSCDYRIDFIEPFDFFPHTPHLETFAFLKKIPHQ